MGILIESSRDEQLRSALGLDRNSEVLLFGCEGATDPAIFEEITGYTPESIFERQTQW